MVLVVSPVLQMMLIGAPLPVIVRSIFHHPDKNLVDVDTIVNRLDQFNTAESVMSFRSHQLPSPCKSPHTNQRSVLWYHRCSMHGVQCNTTISRWPLDLTMPAFPAQVSVTKVEQRVYRDEKLSDRNRYLRWEHPFVSVTVTMPSSCAECICGCRCRHLTSCRSQCRVM